MRPYTATSAHTHTHIHSLSAFCTLPHQSVPKLLPHFGEFPRLITWHKSILGLITLEPNKSVRCLQNVHT